VEAMAPEETPSTSGKACYEGIEWENRDFKNLP